MRLYKKDIKQSGHSNATHHRHAVSNTKRQNGKPSKYWQAIREAIKTTLQGTHREHQTSFRKTSFTEFVSNKTAFGKTSFTTFDSTKYWENFFYNIFPPTKLFKKNFFYKSCSTKILRQGLLSQNCFTNTFLHKKIFFFPKDFIQQKVFTRFFSQQNVPSQNMG